MQNLLAALYAAVCTHVGSPKSVGTLGALHLLIWGRGHGWPSRHGTYCPRFTIPNLIALGLTVRASVRGLKNLGDAGLH